MTTPTQTATTGQPAPDGAPSGGKSRARRPMKQRSRVLDRLVGTGWGVVAWVCGLIFFLPVAWMVMTALKPESQTAVWPPRFSFSPTLSEFRTVFSNGGAGIGSYLEHSAEATILSTVFVVLLGVPVAYALSIKPIDKWRDALFFFITTKMLPVAAAIMPLYVLSSDLHLLDTVWVLIVLYTSMNLPLAVWMLRSFLLEIPTELLEAARLDGAALRREMTEVVLPMTAPGIAATALICVIFAWNELFLAVNLTAVRAATMPVFISAIPTEGLYYGTMAAEATIASLPVIIIGWIAQRQLVRGLSMGAIK